jgi:hypothetical protein
MGDARPLDAHPGVIPGSLRSVSSASPAASAFVGMRVWSRSQQGEQGDGDEVAERGLRPANFSSTVEPGRIDEEDDRRDHDLPEPADDEEEGGEKDAQEPQFGKTHGGCEVEHIPGDPENQRTDQDRCGECRERNGKPTRHEGADSKDAQDDAEDRIHTPSL